jgi:hypothetical protein
VVEVCARRCEIFDATLEMLVSIHLRQREVIGYLHEVFQQLIAALSCGADLIGQPPEDAKGADGDYAKGDE